MTFKVAINGFGRIGRTILRAHYENKKKHDLEIVAINGSGNAEGHNPLCGDNIHVYLSLDTEKKVKDISFARVSRLFAVI